MRIAWNGGYVLIVAVLSVAPAGRLTAQGVETIRSTARIRIDAAEEGRVRRIAGSLISASGDSVRIRPEGPAEVISIPVSNLRRIEVSGERHGRAGHGAALGLVAGFALGAIAGGSCDCKKAGLASVFLGAMTGALGAGLGAMVGSGMRTDRWQEVPLPRASF